MLQTTEWIPGIHGARIKGSSASVSAYSTLADHIVGGDILLPGVGCAELVLASLEVQTALASVAFVGPCVLPGPEAAQCVLRCTRRVSGAFAIESSMPKDEVKFVTHCAGNHQRGNRTQNRTNTACPA